MNKGDLDTMERIGGNSNAIDWKVLLNSIESGQGVSETQGKPQDVNLVMSESDKDILLNMLTTPDIDVPEGMETTPADKLSALIGKLQDGKTFNFTEEQTKTFINTLTALQQKVASLNASGTQGTQNAPAALSSSSTSKALFDIYKMLALLIECAQDMKNAQREQRQAENSAQLTAIQNQADMQRTAALTGLIAGSICCAIQVVATGVAAAKTISNTRAEAALSNEFNVNQSATELGQAQTEAKAAQLELKNFTAEHPVPAEGQPPDTPEITQQRAQLQAKVDETKAAVAEKRIQFESNRQQMKHSDGYDTLQEKQAWTRATFDLSQAFGNFSQTMVRGFVDLKQAEAMAKSADQKKAEETLEQTKDLMASFQDVIDAVEQLAQAVLAAENESMRNAIQA
jgi:hypothetical protein